MSITITQAAEIDRHHRLAMEHADSAIQHACEAGRLLLEVKTQLMHGEWRAWLAKNVSVSERQAQRYMRAAAGKRSTRTRKYDTVSDMPKALERPVPVPAEPKSRRWTQMEIPDLQADLL